MARFISGEIVVVPFPFTDLSSAKVRPALVVASLSRGDVILCQITSQAAGHTEAILLSTHDFDAGHASNRASFALSHRLVTANEVCIRRAVAKVTASKLQHVRERICATILQN